MYEYIRRNRNQLGATPFSIIPYVPPPLQGYDDPNDIWRLATFSSPANRRLFSFATAQAHPMQVAAGLPDTDANFEALDTATPNENANRVRICRNLLTGQNKFKVKIRKLAQQVACEVAPEMQQKHARKLANPTRKRVKRLRKGNPCLPLFVSSFLIRYFYSHLAAAATSPTTRTRSARAEREKARRIQAVTRADSVDSDPGPANNAFEFAGEEVIDDDQAEVVEHQSSSDFVATDPPPPKPSSPVDEGDIKDNQTEVEPQSSAAIENFLPELVIDPEFPPGPTNYEKRMMQQHGLTFTMLKQLRLFVTVSTDEFKLWLRCYRDFAAEHSVQLLPSQIPHLDDDDQELMNHFGLNLIELMQWNALRQVNVDEFNTWLQRVRRGSTVKRFVQYQDWWEPPAEPQPLPVTPQDAAAKSGSVSNLVDLFEKLTSSSSSEDTTTKRRASALRSISEVSRSPHTPPAALAPRDLFQSQWAEQARPGTSLSSIYAPPVVQPSRPA